MTFASIYRNSAVLHLNQAEPAGRRNNAGEGGSDAYVIVNDLDEMFEELKRHGATIVNEPASQSYGMREFQVEDCNHYRLTLAEGIFDEAGATRR